MATVLSGAQVSPSGYPGPLGGDVFPIGAIVDYCGVAEPPGWIFCYGQALNRIGAYADLFAALGTTYGAGNGSTTFNIPDARGFIFAGKDNMGGTPANRLTNTWGVDGVTLGANGGTESHTLTIPQMPNHSHTYSAWVSGASFGVSASLQNNIVGTPTSAVGGNLAHPNVQPTLIVNKIIKYAQVSLSPPTPGTGDVVGPNVSVDGNVAVFDGTTGKVIRDGGIRLPRNYLSGGFISNNATDAINDIDVAAGVCRDDIDQIDISIPVITKRLDALWAAGTNQGGRDTGTLADGPWHVYVIMKVDRTTDVIMTTTYDNPTMPSGYVYKRRLGSVVRSGAGGIRPFKQMGDYFQIVDPVDTHTGASISQNGTFLGQMSSSIPSGRKWLVDFCVTHGCTAPLTFTWIYDPDGQMPSRPSACNAVAGGSITFRFPIWCNAASQVRITAGGGTGTYNYTIGPLGWWDTRRKDQ